MMKSKLLYTLILSALVFSNVSFAQKKSTEPLWWINPNNYVYSELNEPSHGKAKKVTLPDADGDGIPDQFDLEPNTPAGVPTDSRGVSKDTDGDGVPDFKDKELLTPSRCFPVNSDGIGKCKDPDAAVSVLEKRIAELEKKIGTCCGNRPEGDCGIANLPSVQFKAGNKISKEAEAILASIASQLKGSPTCKVKVIGYGSNNKTAQQLSYEKVSAVIKYLVDRLGIAEKRIIFVYGQDGDSSTVDFQPTTEDGPNSVPAPHPSLKSKK